MTTRKQVRDQIIGATMAAGIDPTVYGVARAKMMVKAVQRGIDCADTIATIVRARDSADPASQEIANRLMANKEFVKAMAVAVEGILADVKKLAAAQPTAATAAAANADPDQTNPNAAPVDQEQHGADYPESPSANHVDDPKRGSGMPGADAAITGTFATYLADNAAPDIERRAAQSADAEAAANRRTAVASANTPEDKTRAAFGLPPRPDAPSSLDAFYEESEPARKDRPYDR
ncbi:hypothetical protein WKW79_17400 [Variovorax robiniae]|uniref:Uncharacterized protein n=1 Tax=Variovorax robiniae TaxID=1836199 RepID=A0ABU8X996_9BURK